ncbi:hypothetical protein ACFY8W_31085 [Streptomyces sp. NPDC012637]|uniref:hypothetical protein n=1 Tax=Streptomyces sp. NPDC012637 TaxID=3364842 RepID=UPI0036E2BB78
MDATNDLVRRIEEIRRLLAEAEPESLRSSYLADPSGGRAVLQGSTAPALVSEWNQHPSGLWLPKSSAQTPAPIDLMAVYLTAEEVYGVTPPTGYTTRQLQRLSLESVLRFSAFWLTALAMPGASARSVDERFAGTMLNGPPRDRVLNLLRDTTRRLLVPQALMLLARTAVQVSPGSLPDGVAQGDLVGALLCISQTMGRQPETGPTVIEDRPGPLGREIIANQHFNHTWSVSGVLARYARRWLELPAEHQSEPAVVDLSQAYEDCTGVRLEDLAAIAGYLWARTVQGCFVVERAELSTLDIPHERREGVLELISNSMSGLREELQRERAELRTEWSFDPFQRWPVIKLPEERLLILDPRHLVSRAFGWLPIWDIKFPPPGRIKPSGHKKLAARAEQTLRHFSEVYVSEVLHHIAQDASTARRVYDDEQLKAAYTAQGQRIADAAIDYPGAWIVIEVTTTQLRREAATAVPDESQIEDIDKLIEELDQINATINSLRADEAALTGIHATLPRRFYPLLVLPEGFPVNPITLTVIRERARSRNLLQGPDTAPLEIADIEELEMIEGVQEDAGPSLLEILQSKNAGSLRNAGFREHILHVMRLSPPKPSRQAELFHAAMKPLFEVLPKAPAER